MNELSSQTNDLTILLLLNNSLNVDLCQELSNSENLFILTHYKGLSPIIPPYQRSILAQGVDIPTGRYPFSKLYSVGLNIEF